MNAARRLTQALKRLMPNPKVSGTAHQPVGPASPTGWRFVRSRPGSRPPLPTKQSTRRRSHFTGARKQPETQTGYQYALVNNGSSIMWHVIISLIYRQACRSYLAAARKQRAWA